MALRSMTVFLNDEVVLAYTGKNFASCHAASLAIKSMIEDKCCFVLMKQQEHISGSPAHTSLEYTYLTNDMMNRLVFRDSMKNDESDAVSNSAEESIDIRSLRKALAPFARKECKEFFITPTPSLLDQAING